tara:strand:+ start:575 stop:1675 length:1101 start_codon:yes stop_codon:yes gene_type:complete
MTVVILVAGSGTRFRDEKPKCLVDINGITLLEWTISLIREVDDEVPIRLVTGHKYNLIQEYVDRLEYNNLETVHNLDYENDQNILSAHTGMAGIDTDILILEGDCIFNKKTMEELVTSIGKNKNIIFTKGESELNKTNAIIKSNKDGNFAGYIIGKRPLIDNKEWYNMTGSVLFNKYDIKNIISWLNKNDRDPRSTYYFQPLVEKEEIFEVEVMELNESSDFLSFNTQVEYLVAMEKLGLETKIRLIDTKFLKHVEGFSEKRVEWLKNKIIKEGIWNKPICIDSKYGIVMDGQHRMEVAKSLNVSKIPAILFEHGEVEFWSLRDNHIVDLESIIDKSLSGKIYPYKTVKYSFPIEIPKCSINLEEL